MLAVTSYSVPETEAPGLRAAAPRVFAALAGCTGHERSRLGRATDDPTAWVLVSEWTTIGAYRRALSSYEVRVALSELQAWAVSHPAAFEVLLDQGPEGLRARDSDLAG